jgi:hypothetical protein
MEIPDERSTKSPSPVSDFELTVLPDSGAIRKGLAKSRSPKAAAGEYPQLVDGGYPF